MPSLAEKRAAKCPCHHLHTNGPSGYVNWHAWAAGMTRTHTQHKCRGCGLWAIWKPRARKSYA